jgi:hypothetical protein
MDAEQEKQLEKSLEDDEYALAWAEADKDFIKEMNHARFWCRFQHRLARIFLPRVYERIRWLELENNSDVKARVK